VSLAYLADIFSHLNHLNISLQSQKWLFWTWMRRLLASSKAGS
jgi:hypothetical protein